MGEKARDVSMNKGLESLVTVEVLKGGGSRESVKRFQVEGGAAHSRVLDLLVKIRETQDSSLGFRYACRVGMCGSCAMVINGKEGLACQTTIKSLGTKRISLGPLRGLPVLKDLKVDMEPFFNTLRRANAAFIPKHPQQKSLGRIPPNGSQRAKIEKQNGCITCGACFSACEWGQTRTDYLGPAALNRIFMLCHDERDLLGKKRVRNINSDSGILRCHTVGNCWSVCPVGIPLLKGLVGLKKVLWKV